MEGGGLEVIPCEAHPLVVEDLDVEEHLVEVHPPEELLEESCEEPVHWSRPVL